MLLGRRLVDWGLAALLLVVPALVLRSSLKEPEETTAVDTAVLRVSAPLQAVVSWMVDKVGGAWSRYVALVDVEEENRELRAENEQLRRDLAEATRRAIDIAALEEMLDLAAETDADTVGARVIAASMSPQYRVLRISIDLRTRSGDISRVREKMPVITSSGLVGRIERVYGSYADVVLTTDKGSNVSVMVQRSGLRGTVFGHGSPDSYTCTFEARDDAMIASPIEEGDKLVTDGTGARQGLPAGIEVGVVTRVRPKEAGMFPEVHVEPSVDFSRLQGVTVLLSTPPPPDPNAETQRRSESAFGVRPF